MDLNRFERFLSSKSEGISLILIECNTVGFLLLFLLKLFLISFLFFGFLTFLTILFRKYAKYLHFKYLASDHQDLKSYLEYNKKSYHKEINKKFAELLLKDKEIKINEKHKENNERAEKI